MSSPPRVMTPLPSAVSQPVGPLDAERTHVVVVTGLSGAGKSTALHALEDLGYFCIDNLPTVLAPLSAVRSEVALRVPTLRPTTTPRRSMPPDTCSSPPSCRPAPVCASVTPRSS